MITQFVELNETGPSLAALAERAGRGVSMVITKDGRPLARLGPIEPLHRANDTRLGVTLAPEFEPEDVRLARLEREGEVPYRLRKLPRH